VDDSKLPCRKKADRNNKTKRNAMLLRIADYPQLKLIAWNRHGHDLVEEEEALALYERNWRYVDENMLNEEERQLIGRLAEQYGNGVLHV
jgi:hypothetical protein